MISIRATGIPSWIVVITVRAACSMLVNGHTAVEIDSGRP